MIVSELSIFQKHVLVNDSFDFELVKVEINKIESVVLPKYISEEACKHIENYNGPEPNILKVKNFLESYISNYAFVRSMPKIQNRLMNSGIEDFGDNQHWSTKRDLIRSYLDSATESLNEAIRVMNISLDLFEDYRNSEFFKKRNELLIRTGSDLTEFIETKNPWLTLEALTPSLRHIQLTELQDYQPDVFLHPSTENQKQAQYFMKAIICHRAKAQAATSNMFFFDGLGFSVKLEKMPWEKDITTSENLKNIYSAELDKASFYRNKLSKLVSENPTEFGIKETPPPTMFKDYGSGLGLF